MRPARPAPSWYSGLPRHPAAPTAPAGTRGAAGSVKWLTRPGPATTIVAIHSLPPPRGHVRAARDRPAARPNHVTQGRPMEIAFAGTGGSLETGLSAVSTGSLADAGHSGAAV